MINYKKYLIYCCVLTIMMLSLNNSAWSREEMRGGGEQMHRSDMQAHPQEMEHHNYNQMDEHHNMDYNRNVGHPEGYGGAYNRGYNQGSNQGSGNVTVVPEYVPMPSGDTINGQPIQQ
ncbi:MAG: hypothetical protein H0W88_00500 [Parachlamydiaceae bacterium]|nr:hypothetical protein [Parachlamydiaceae bacterium]